MESADPYVPPQTDLLTDQVTFAQIKILSTKGRIGRLRYIVYTLGLSVLVYLGMSVLSVLVAKLGLFFAPDEGIIIGVVITILFILAHVTILGINVLLTIQRSHDFNVTGWLSLVLLFPLTLLLFWIIPGGRNANQFGPPPTPNKGRELAVMVTLLLLGVAGLHAILADPT